MLMLVILRLKNQPSVHVLLRYEIFTCNHLKYYQVLSKEISFLKITFLLFFLLNFCFNLKRNKKNPKNSELLHSASVKSVKHYGN